MRQALINGNVLTPDGFKEAHSVIIEAGQIATVCPDKDCPSDIEITFDLEQRMLLPGFVDVQVNGGGGILFNDVTSVEGIRAIGAAHRRFGTTGFLPTLISDDPEVMAAAIAAVDAAIFEGVPGVLGIHLEGPYLNSEKKGVHDATKFSQIGAAEIALLSSLKHGKTLVTLAPELTTPDVIKTLVARGVVVAAGHTQADYAQTVTAMEAGLTGFTHLFNAMRPLRSRDPGVIAAALEDPRAWCGIIADGHHVDPAMLRLAMRAKTNEQIFLVTDAMPSVGALDKTFQLGTTQVQVLGGKCVTDDGTLAGSDLNMMRAVTYAAENLGVNFEYAVRMASAIPSQFLGLGKQLGSIEAGLQADLICVTADFNVAESWIKGEPGLTP